MSKVAWQADVEKYIGVKDVMCFQGTRGGSEFSCQTSNQGKTSQLDTLRMSNYQNFLSFSIKSGRAIIYIDSTGQSHLLGNGSILGKHTGDLEIYMQARRSPLSSDTTLREWQIQPYASIVSNPNYYCYSIGGWEEKASFAISLTDIETDTQSECVAFMYGTAPLPINIIGKTISLDTDILKRTCRPLTSSRSIPNYDFFRDFKKDYDIVKNNVFLNNDMSAYIKKCLDWGIGHGCVTDTAYTSNPDVAIDFFYNIYTSHDYAQCIKYLLDGTVPSDAECNTCDSDTGQVDSGQNTSSDDGDDTSGKDSAGDDGHVMDNSLPIAPSASALSMNNSNIYSISSAQLQAFQEWFSKVSFTEILANYVTGKYNNLSSSILELYDMPVEDVYLGTKTTETIVVGGVNTEISADAFHGVAPLRTLGTYTITKKFDSYMNYAPYSSIELYLPYVGWSTLDTNLYSPSASEDRTTLTVQCMYDVLTGKITYFLLCNNTTMDIKEATMMTKLEITLEDAVQYKSALANTLTQKSIGIITGAESGSIGTMAGSIMGGAQAQPISVKGSASDCAGLYSPQYCYILFKYPSYNRPSNYGKMFGFPCFKNRHLSSLSGFTKCINPKITFTNTVVTENEQTKIYELLESGVYL